jgi:hypothetical protein
MMKQMWWQEYYDECSNGIPLLFRSIANIDDPIDYHWLYGQILRDTNVGKFARLIFSDKRGIEKLKY